MKIKNNTIFTIIITFLGVYILLAGYLKFTNIRKVEVSPKIEPGSQIEPKALSVESELETEIVSKTLSEQTNKINVSLSILDSSYSLEVNENISVFELMQQLQKEKENEFSFKFKEYPGLGIFINEINNKKGEPGAYWIYYINDKEASVGVSSYILKEGDSILWKQE